MVSQADRELISNFVTELRPYLETVTAGVQEFAQPNRDGVVVGQAVQALVMIRGAGQILMVDGLVSIAGWLTESFELIQNNPEIAPPEAARRLAGLSNAMEDFLHALDRGDDVDPIVLRARTIYEAIPVFSGPLPGTGKLRRRTDLDALFGDDERTAPTDRIVAPDAVDTEKLSRVDPEVAQSQSGPMAEMPEAMPTVPLPGLSAAPPESRPTVPLAGSPDSMPTVPLQHMEQTPRTGAGEPARIVPIPPQPTEKLPAVDPELREIFEDEALEIIGAFGDNIRILAGSPEDFEAIERLNRAAHTLKGAANMTGFPVVGQIGAAIERLMDEHMERGKPITRDALELVAVSWKMLRAMMPHLSDLSGFTSPSNSVVQRANVLREQLALADAEAETLSIDHDRYGRPTTVMANEQASAHDEPAQDEPVMEAPVADAPVADAPEQAAPQDEVIDVAVRPTDEDTAKIQPVVSAEVAPEPVDVAFPVDEAPDAVVVEPLETAAEPADFEVVEDVAEQAAEPEADSAEVPFWDQAAEEPRQADEKPQSEPFWTPGTEELMRSAVNTDQLVAELHGIADFVDDLDTELDAPEPEPFFEAEEPAGELHREPEPADSGEWLTSEAERPGTDLLNFDARPQTEPFWGKLESTAGDYEPLATDEPVTMDPFFEPVVGASPFARIDDEHIPDDVEVDLSDYADLFPPPPVDGFTAEEAAETSNLAAGEQSIDEPAAEPLMEQAIDEPYPVVQEPETDVHEAVTGQLDAAEAETEAEPQPAYDYAFDFTSADEAPAADALIEDAWEAAAPEWPPVADPVADMDEQSAASIDTENVAEAAAAEDAAEPVSEAFEDADAVEAPAEDIVIDAPAETYMEDFVTEPVSEAHDDVVTEPAAEAFEEDTIVEPVAAPYAENTIAEPVVEAHDEDIIVEPVAEVAASVGAVEVEPEAMAGDFSTEAADEVFAEVPAEEPFFEAHDTEAFAGEPVVEEPVDPTFDIVERVAPATTELAEIMATAMLGSVEALARREPAPAPSQPEVTPEDDVLVDESAFEPVPVDTFDAEIDVEPFMLLDNDEDWDVAPEFIETEPEAGSIPEIDAAVEAFFGALPDAEPAFEVDALVEPEIELDADEHLLEDFDLEPFDASDEDERGAYDFSGEFPEIDDEELDRLVAEIEGDSLTTPDWLHQGETPDVAAEVAEDEIIEPRDLPRSDVLSAPETGPLSPTVIDALQLGTLGLDRFLVGEGSAALSSALLDMAFSTPLPDAADDDEAAPGSISVFDESSERALEIEMFETFSLEAADHLEALGRAAMHLDRDPHAAEPVIDIKRALHTLKGAAAAAEFDAISEQAHELEDSLANYERLDTLHERGFTAELFMAIEEIEAQLARRKDELFGATEDEQQSPSLRVDIARVDGLLNTVGELVVNRSGLEERLERLGATLGDLSTAAARLQRSNVLLEREAHAEDAIGRLLRGELAQGDSILVDASSHAEWDTLEMDRYTEFDRLIRQLAEVGADVSAAVGEIAALRGDLDSFSARQRRLTTTLQDELMGIRMVPIASLAPRLYRVVRRAAGRRGKEVSLVLEGGETPFDKLLLDTLSESLLHLLRNAVDHGIEDVPARRRLGKPETGTVRIRAYRDGSEAVIEIIDDGAGIDHEAIARQALANGLINDTNISREAALALIFEPGFTTRGEADDISGRGLGLEIVAQTVARYKGRVGVDSIPGRGTVFSLRLPVMLSVIQAFLVGAGDGQFAIPVANVDYVVDRIDQPLTQIGESIVVESGDQIIPVVDVGARLGRASVPIMERDGGWVMVSEVAGKRWALVVDDLHGQQEIVVKPMGRYLRSMPGLMGATILGHGEVALIVDVPTMLGVDTLGTHLTPAIETVASSEVDETPVSPQTDSPFSDRPRVILIVDDSLSVRRVVSRTVERNGWVAVMARDGAEALEILDQAPVDIVITDIEMPRMDGFELITAIRARSALNDLPVVVLTSRSGEKHRERAFSLGADEYLVKPFQEQELVGVVEDLAHAPAQMR